MGVSRNEKEIRIARNRRHKNNLLTKKNSLKFYQLQYLIIRITISHLKIKILVQDQGGAEF